MKNSKGLKFKCVSFSHFFVNWNELSHLYICRFFNFYPNFTKKFSVVTQNCKTKKWIPIVGDLYHQPSIQLWLLVTSGDDKLTLFPTCRLLTIYPTMKAAHFGSKWLISAKKLVDIHGGPTYTKSAIAISTNSPHSPKLVVSTDTNFS